MSSLHTGTKNAAPRDRGTAHTDKNTQADLHRIGKICDRIDALCNGILTRLEVQQ